ncbi:conjugal transfer protein TraB [Rhizobium rhizogenes]|uniref:conjugal transfer protein TraB n=1 Tax=Rhizobium rhizogenes TaxID=359 RepID=UPI0006489423|nr:conjugal transfer protein TraB [Rhizobium rhizogenes]
MHREVLGSIGLITAAAIVGTFGWSGKVQLLPLAILFPLVWSRAPSRVVAAMIAAAYFLAASRGLPQGVVNFYGSREAYGYALWLMAAAGFVFVHAVCCTRRSGVRRSAGYAIASILMILPPFGIVGWAHPLTAAGVLFPGWGWIGLLATATGMLALTTRRWPIAVIVLGGFWVWSAACWVPPSLLKGWSGVDTPLGQSLGRGFDLEQQRSLVRAVREEAALGARVVVLPESALGFWTPTMERFWRTALDGNHVTVLAGASVVNPDGYENVMASINRDGGSSIYRERMPVPVSMWQPWPALMGKSGGARAAFFANPIVDVLGSRVAILICYEQLITWPILQSALHRPEVIVAAGNGWWTAGTSIVPIQQASAFAWASLFNIPVVFAFNS